MKRSNYYPNQLPERPEWHTNFAAKLQIYGPALPLTAAQINAAVADNRYLAYGLGDWISNVRDFAPACTAALANLATGTGGEAFVFTPYNTPVLPTLPAGITEVLPGALDRTFRLVQVIKGLPGYTDDMGMDLGIIGEEDTAEHTRPEFTLKAEAGDGCNCVRVRHKKFGHYAVAVYGKRGSGSFELLGISKDTPFQDARPLLVAGQPEIREYKLRFWDAGTESGDWTDVASITVSP
ncbi:MAG: hypothetical protein ACKVY0_03195 [Prosthecobacter sp.]|uniref:hypothetical protein n=1 Tax=Prosthecobacter sp. TaxID=1965333 RepID=UPI003900AAB0